MKRKLLAFVVSLALVVSGISINPTKTRADDAKTYTFGTTATGTITKTSYYTLVSYSTDTYAFDVGKDMDITIDFVAATDSLRWTLSNSGSSGGNYIYKSNTVDAGTRNTYKMFITAGSYTFKVTSGGSEYAFTMNDTNSYHLNFAKSTENISGGLKKNVSFTYDCSYDYAKKYFSMKNSNGTVADCTYSINTDGTGTITLDPKKIGKTVVSIGLTGGNVAKYTCIVKSMYVFVAKGQSLKLPKPIGVKKAKWSSKKKKIATVNKKGKVKGKKDGRGKVFAKAGKVTYTYNIVVTDFIKLGKKAYKVIKENVRNPEKLKIYNVYSGFDKNIAKGVTVPVVFIDFGYTNSYGAMERGKWIAYYDDVHELKYFSVNSYSDLMKRKTIKPAKIK